MRTRKLPWASALGLVIAATFAVACGPKVAHDGYKSAKQKPWKNPKALEFDEDGEAEVDDVINYPKRRRARWYAVDLPTFGKLNLKLSVQPIEEEESGDVDLAMEILDSSYRVLERADKDEDDAGDLNKRRSLDELDAGRYYIHIYAQARLDRADFTLRAIFERARKAYESDFPADVPYVGILPAVPLFDDTPTKPVKRKIVRRKRPTKKPTQTIRGRIAGISSTGKGTRIKIDRGTSSGVAKGWRGVVITKSGKAIQDGRFTVSKVSSSESYGLVRATVDSVNAAKYVRLSPP